MENRYRKLKEIVTENTFKTLSEMPLKTAIAYLHLLMEDSGWVDFDEHYRRFLFEPDSEDLNILEDKRLIDVEIGDWDKQTIEDREVPRTPEWWERDVRVRGLKNG